MDFNDTAEEAKFRKEAYEWLKANADLKEGPKDGWRSASEEEGLQPLNYGRSVSTMRAGRAFVGTKNLVAVALQPLSK